MNFQNSANFHKACKILLKVEQDVTCTLLKNNLKVARLFSFYDGSRFMLNSEHSFFISNSKHQTYRLSVTSDQHICIIFKK